MREGFRVAIGGLVLVLLPPAVRQLPAGDAPYPPSPVVTDIQWAPASEVVRRAPGSDNWPLTWGDDDAMYAAYGDGRGFKPRSERRLSLGLARIAGGPADFTGANIPTPTGERTGNGSKGIKASGMLMVRGVLYMWTRNASNSQLAWSTDRGQTWSWSNWRFTESFGYPTFLNFGRDYAGSRDGYVYVYSHDGSSAYQPADSMVLARVPADHLRDRDAYEFLHSVDQGEPVWTRDIAQRGAVFRHKGRCYRSGISYNAGLGRYLWCQTLPAGDARYAGGFGIYDAPQPWGPWTTVAYYEQWDMGPGETSCFPAKWMSDDGRTVHLVFSGEDSFSVRRAVLSTGAFPGKTWARVPPRDVGLDEDDLNAAADYALTGAGAGCVTRHGLLVRRWGDPRRLYAMKSTTKSVGSALLGLAIGDGKIDLADRAVERFPDFGIPPNENAATGWLDEITLLHLATHTSGFEKHGGYRRLLFRPGSRWHYSDGATNWLADCLTLAYRTDLDALLFQRVLDPIGVARNDLKWRTNSYREPTLDGHVRREFGSGMRANVDAMARIGYLFLRRGRWGEDQILPASFVDRVARPDARLVSLPPYRDLPYADAAPHYGILWWNNADGTLGRVPRDAFWSWGLYDSLIVVIPSLDMVAVRAGRSWKRKWDGNYEVLRPFLEPLARSVRNPPATSD